MRMQLLPFNSSYTLFAIFLLKIAHLTFFVKINGVNQIRDGIKLKARKQKTERFPTSYFINYAREIQPSKQ